MSKKRILGAVLAVLVGLGAGGVGLAEELKVAPGVRPIPQGVVPTIPCPAGWHATPGSDPKNFTCVPNKPAPIKCPPGTEYRATDCQVGCRTIIR